MVFCKLFYGKTGKKFLSVALPPVFADAFFAVFDSKKIISRSSLTND